MQADTIENASGTEPQLPPCPFCRKTDLVIEELASAWGTNEESPHVVCNNCGGSAPLQVWETLSS